MIYWTRDPVVVRIKSISFICSSLACRFVYFNDSNDPDSESHFGTLRTFSFNVLRVFWVRFPSSFLFRYCVYVLIAQFFLHCVWKILSFPTRLDSFSVVWRHFHVCWPEQPEINSKLLFFRLPVISRCHFTHVCACVCFYRYSFYICSSCLSFCVSAECIHTSNCLPTRNALNLFALQTYFLHLLWQIIKTSYSL